MEDGTVVLVGATTENPSFELNAALLSRARVLTFRPHGAESLAKLLERAESRGPASAGGRRRRGPCSCALPTATDGRS